MTRCEAFIMFKARGRRAISKSHMTMESESYQYLLAETIGQRTRYDGGDNTILVALVKAASMTADRTVKITSKAIRGS